MESGLRKFNAHKTENNLPDELVSLDGRIGIRNSKRTNTKSYNREEVVANHNHPCPEGTRKIKGGNGFNLMSFCILGHDVRLR